MGVHPKMGVIISASRYIVPWLSANEDLTMLRPKSATVDLKIRMKEPLRARIEKAARSNGLSLNAEVVQRLDRSLQEEDVIRRVLGTEDTFALVRLISQAKEMIERGTGRTCDDSYTAHHVRLAISAIVDGLIPPKDVPPQSASARRIGERATHGLPVETARDVVDRYGEVVARGLLDRPRVKKLD